MGIWEVRYFDANYNVRQFKSLSTSCWISSACSHSCFCFLKSPLFRAFQGWAISHTGQKIGRFVMVFHDRLSWTSPCKLHFVGRQCFKGASRTSCAWQASSEGQRYQGFGQISMTLTILPLLTKTRGWSKRLDDLDVLEVRKVKLLLSYHILPVISCWNSAF